MEKAMLKTAKWHKSKGSRSCLEVEVEEQHCTGSSYFASLECATPLYSS